MKKLIGAILATTILSTSVSASEFACKNEFERDTAYHLPTVMKGSMTKRLVVDIPKLCFSAEAWSNEHGGLNDGLMGCLFASVIWGVVPLYWAPGAGLAMAVPAFLGFKFGMDHDYDTAVAQTRLNDIVMSAVGERELNQGQIRYLKRKYFKRHDYTDQEIADFFEYHGNSKILCSNPAKEHTVVGVTEEGLKYIRTKGYNSITGLLLASLIERETPAHEYTEYRGATKLLNYVQKRYGRKEVSYYGETVTPSQMFELARDYAQEHGIKRVFKY